MSSAACSCSRCRPRRPDHGEGALVGDTPLQPFGGLEDMAWSPDGKTLYFVARESGAAEPTSTDTDIYSFTMGDTAPVNLTDANEATDGTPAPSPDGKWLAFLAMERPAYEADRLRIMLRDLAGINIMGGDVVEVSPPFDTTGATAIAGAHVATEILSLLGHRMRTA